MPKLAATSTDEFGGAVSLSGHTAIVGAPGDRDGVLARGTARVYVRSGSTWSLQQKLTAADPTVARFGRAVSLSGDVVAVGTDPSNGGGPGGLPGEVHVFLREGATWTPLPRLHAPDGADGDHFTEFQSGLAQLLDGVAAKVASQPPRRMPRRPLIEF